MQFKQFLEFFGTTTMPADPSSYWKLPSIDQNASTGGGFTGMFYSLQPKKQLERSALEKLSMKAEQMTSAINAPTSTWQNFFPYTAILFKNTTRKPDIKGSVIIDLAIEDLRKTTGGGGYHQALTPFEFKYAEDNRIIIPDQNDKNIANVDINALRNKILEFRSGYQSGLYRSQLLDKAASTIGSQAAQSVTGYGMTKSATGGV